MKAVEQGEEPVESIHIVVPALTFDPGAANDLIDELFGSLDWVTTDDDGETVQDLSKAKAKLLLVFQNHHVIPETAVARLRNARTIEAEISERGVSLDQLYLEVFGAGAPGAGSSDDLTPEEQEAAALLKATLWKWCGAGRTSYVQTEAKRMGYLLVETKVSRGMVRFMTDSFELTKTYLLKAKVLSSVERNSKSTEAWLAEMMERLPTQMALPLARYARAELRQIWGQIKHADPAWVQAALGAIGGPEPEELEAAESATA